MLSSCIYVKPYNIPQLLLELGFSNVYNHTYLLTMILTICACSVLINVFSHIICLSCFMYKSFFIRSELIFTGIYPNISYCNLFKSRMKYIIALGHSITGSLITYNVVFIKYTNVLFYS